MDVIRHFTRLSTWNYAIDLGLYPLGSCTMKYNPRINEQVARVDGLAWIHPYQPDSLSQGAMQVMRRAGALPARDHRHGCDHAAARRRRAWRVHGHPADSRRLAEQGNPRKKILIPDSAHGTNPATAHMAGYAVENIASNDRAAWWIPKRWRARSPKMSPGS